NLVERLEGVGQFALLTIPHINGGGCAAYAAAVARGLQRLNVHTWALIDGCADGRDSVKQDLAQPITEKSDAELRALAVRGQHILVQFHWSGHAWTHDAFRTAHPI